ncbi:MAG: hypothetical protein JWQ35_427 [Bacteriovoracaceae bacterium]|nr:hypothetical protein [Bacteriovoracaceae bacterium]
MTKPTLLLLFLGALFCAAEIHAQTISASVGGIASTPTKVTPGSVFWNPATIGKCNGTQMETNLTLVGGWVIYDRDGIDPNTNLAYKSSDMSAVAPNPFISVSSPLGTKDFRFGYATYFPAGVMASYDPNGAQRYSLIEGLVIPWQNQFTVAYRPNDHWSIAMSGMYSLGFFKSDLDIDLESFMANIMNSDDIPKENSALTARAKIPMQTANAFSGAIGVYYSPSYQWSFGLSFFSPVEYTFKGRLHLQTPKAVGNLSAGLRALGVEDTIDAEVVSKSTIPPFLQMGASYQPYGYYTIELFGRYTFASLFPSISVELRDSALSAVKSYSRPGKDLKDDYLVGVLNSFSLWQRWTLGLNTTYTSNSVRDDYLSSTLMDFDTLLVGPFAQYQWSRKLKIGAEYAHSFMFDRTAKNTQASNAIPNSAFRPISTDGTYRAAADRFGLMVKYAF